MSRKQSRELAFKLLYQLAFNGGEVLNDESLKLVTDEKVDTVEMEYIRTLCNHVQTNKETIDAHIERLSSGFKLDRMFSVDITVLRLALAEILYMPTPNVVVVDTCLTIAKKYSTDKSSGFVNGILATFLKEQDGK